MSEPISTYIAPGATSQIVEMTLDTAAGAPYAGLATQPSAPPTPVLVTGTGGSLAAVQYWVVATYTTTPGNGVANGETTQSVAATATPSASGIITANLNTIPSIIGGVNWYISNTAVTGPFLFAGSTSSPTTNFTFTTMPGSGANPPGTNTAFPNGFQITYQRDNGTETKLTLSVGGTYGTFTSAGQLSESAVCPGKYTVCLADAANASGASVVRLDAQGVSGLRRQSMRYALGTASVSGSTDAYLRLGAPAGASVSADIAELDTLLDAVPAATTTALLTDTPTANPTDFATAGSPGAVFKVSAAIIATATVTAATSGSSFTISVAGANIPQTGTPFANLSLRALTGANAVGPTQTQPIATATPVTATTYAVTTAVAFTATPSVNDTFELV